MIAPMQARRWLREPIVVFAALGAALFALDAALRDDAPEPEPDARVLVIDAAIAREVDERLATRLDRAPTDAEREAATRRWIEDEVLYREGLARGFAVNDPTVRARVGGHMARVLREGVVVPEPTEAELRAAFEADPNRWGSSARVDFTQVFVEGHDASADARAAELLALLREGASPTGLGDRFSGGRRFRGRTLAQIEATFGAAFAEGLDSAETGAWTSRTSPAGHHLVRVDAVAAGRGSAFEAARADVRRSLVEAREDEAFRERLRALVAGWEVRRP